MSFDIEKIVSIAKQEYSKHHLGCKWYNPPADHPDPEALGGRECWGKCDECFADDFRKRLNEENTAPGINGG